MNDIIINHISLHNGLPVCWELWNSREVEAKLKLAQHGRQLTGGDDIFRCVNIMTSQVCVTDIY